VGEPSPTEERNELPPTQADEPTSDEEEAAPGSTTEPGSATDTTTAGPIEDKKIEQFADAYLAVQTIQQKAAAELQSAKDPQAADKVKATAESDMIAAVERSGLQVPEFNRIVERMASDTEVRSRVAAKLQERNGNKPPQRSRRNLRRRHRARRIRIRPTWASRRRRRNRICRPPPLTMKPDLAPPPTSPQPRVRAPMLQPPLQARLRTRRSSSSRMHTSPCRRFSRRPRPSCRPPRIRSRQTK
jgi:hypothetical protein